MLEAGLGVGWREHDPKHSWEERGPDPLRDPSF